jgi:hypothetical protein
MRGPRLFLLSAGFLFACLGAHAAADDVVGRAVLAKGYFSYQAPPGWEVTEPPQAKFPIAIESTPRTPAASIYASIETFRGDLHAYVETTLKEMARNHVFRHFHVQSRRPFVTAAGLDGFRAVTTERLVYGASKTVTRKILYFFDGGGNQKVVLTATFSC